MVRGEVGRGLVRDEVGRASFWDELGQAFRDELGRTPLWDELRNKAFCDTWFTGLPAVAWFDRRLLFRVNTPTAVVGPWMP